ncbi:MAG: extracellular solute-binding protein [Oscillospiraceae bacterium]
MNKTKRTASLLLAVVLLLGTLAGCGGKTDGGTAEETPEFIYVPTYVKPKTDIEINYVSASGYFDGKLYFLASVVSGKGTATQPEHFASASDLNARVAVAPGSTTAEMVPQEYDTYRDGMFVMNADGTGMEELTAYAPNKLPEGTEGNSYVNSMTLDSEGNIWVCETLSVTIFDLPADFDPETQDKWQYYKDSTETFTLRKLDKTGAEQLSIDLSTLKGEEDYFYVQNVLFDDAGNIYVVAGQSLYVLDAQGKLLFKLGDKETNINTLVRMKDGSISVMLWDNAASKQVFKPVDLKAKAFGTAVDAPVNGYNFYPGSGDFDVYYNSDTSLFGYNVTKGESTKLLSWINCDVDSNSLSAINVLPNGDVFCMSNSRDDTGKQNFELVTLVKTPYAEVEQKTPITFACMYLDWNLRGQILKFNKTNAKYHIEVHDYSEYNTQDDYTKGLTKLSTEIISGKVPDILDTNGLPIRQYAAKGLLEDLWTYIESDKDLGGKEGFIKPVFEALSQDGKLYQIASSFSINTVVGSSAIVGDTPGWTLDDMYAALEKMPEGAEIFSMGTTKDQILSQSCAMGLDTYVDWETGKCTFDSPEFKKMLEFANQFPLTFDWDKINWEAGDYEDDATRITAGKQMLAMFYAGDFQNFQQYRAMFGGDVTFIGFPSESRNGNAFRIDSGLAMSSKCSDKAGAWEFMRTILTEDFQKTNTWNFPTNKAAFDAKLKEAMTKEFYTDENGNQVEQPKYSYSLGGPNGGTEVKVYALTQAEADQFMALINSTNRIFANDQNIMTIVNEECAAFFAGEKTVDDASKNIQSRVSLYVNEQK